MTQHISTRSVVTTDRIPVPMATPEELARIRTRRERISKTETGSIQLPTGLVPVGRERDRLQELHRISREDLARSTRKEVHDRIHGFLMGFASHRNLDLDTAKLVISGYVDAVEEMMIIQAVHRACKAWNQRKFAWANCRFPPDPAEFGRAVAEVKADMEVQTYDLGLILLAGPLTDPDKATISEEQRDKVIKDALSKGRIGERRPLNEVMMDEAREEQRARAAAALSDVVANAKAEIEAIAVHRRGGASGGMNP